MIADFLNKQFSELKKKNHRISLRSFSKKVGIPPGRMSELLGGKRQLSAYYATKLAEGLALDPKERDELFSLVSIQSRHSPKIQAIPSSISSTLYIDPNKISEAKEMIEEFIKKISKNLETGPYTEPYNLTVQLSPLTTLERTSSVNLNIEMSCTSKVHATSDGHR